MPAGQSLQQDRHQVGNQDNAEQPVANREPPASRSPSSRIHVTDGDQKARAGESQKLAQKSRRTGVFRQAGVNLGQAGTGNGVPPALVSAGFAG